MDLQNENASWQLMNTYPWGLWQRQQRLWELH